MAKNKKKKVILAIVVALLVVVIAVLGYIFFGVVGVDEKRVYTESDTVTANVNTGETVLDDKVTYQTMNGFGASACWWSQDVGGWENSKEILTYLYDSENGIGLNIYRYNLGAGSKGDEHILTENRSTFCFLNSDGTYDFSTDANAQSALATAKELAGDDLRVTLFCNSAPVSLTDNGAGYGSALSDDDPWITNISEENYEAFADFCYNSADYFINQGYRVTDVSPINEPQYSWAAWYNEDGSYSVNQEGCHYSKTEAAALYNAMIERFNGSEVDSNGCKISMFESGSAEGKGSSCAAYLDCILGKGPKYVFKNKELRDYFDTVSFHSYWSSTETKEETAQYLADKYSTYDVVCTEYCQMTNDENTGVYDLISQEEDGTNGMTIEYGVAMAKVIMDDLTILNAKEWDWWTACSYGVYPDGLVYINADDHNDIQTSKRLWCLGNFSKFIDENATRIACSSGIDSISSCAFVNPDNSTVVVYVNNTDTDQSTTLNCADDYSVYTTSAQYDLEKTDSGEAGDITVNLPAMSVVTVIYE
jgi:O-glycosyl hydrolase